VEGCEQERQAVKVSDSVPTDKGVIPLYFPADEEAMDALREIATKGCNPRNADHTLRNVSSFRDWENVINEAACKKLYYPQLNDTVIERIQRGEAIP
jgi:trimethylamine--corrinoid protein Co-methyltransferase